jgi:hypothetical protein
VANISRLADSAEKKLRDGSALTRPDAARKAIRGQGISFGPDVNRLTPLVLTELARRGGNVTASKRGRAKAARDLHEKVAP